MILNESNERKVKEERPETSGKIKNKTHLFVFHGDCGKKTAIENNIKIKSKGSLI